MFYFGTKWNWKCIYGLKGLCSKSNIKKFEVESIILEKFRIEIVILRKIGVEIVILGKFWGQR